LGRKKEVNPDAIKFVLSKIKEGLNLSEIHTKLKEEAGFNYAYSLLYDRIKKELRYEWDKSQKLWIKKDYSANQEPLLNSTKDCKDSELKQMVLDLPSSSDKSITINEFNNLKNDIESVKYHISEIRLQMNKIFDIVSTIKSDDPYKESYESVNKFVAILTSGNDKCSLTLNSKVKEEILEMMSTELGITGNESKAINTALALTLFYLRDNQRLSSLKNYVK